MALVPAVPISSPATRDRLRDFGGGGGAGVSIQPVAFLIVSEGNARILPVNMPADSSTDRLIELIPDAINGVQSLFGKRGKKEDAAPETEIAPTEE